MPERMLRAVRGAITVERDERSAIVEGTVELLSEMLARNDARPGDLVSLIFTATPDLRAEFPAVAARRLGLGAVALLCAREIEVPGAVPRCVRVLMHFYTRREVEELRHVYLGEARGLRTDLGYERKST